eukprot:CAMPEP_0184499596 /NCGR_PEP_ID=MMETSP0113_2-20130426/41912_1 /TAXON_ID=91329 /ORGANISM="Norrisiella sphaerica, Strain BC52" /LENGTH=52 /DNA_ID=CAMNT_0026887553 /DNA_START=1 /DNA_END=156 /DNA_ORIENTATION=+
MPSTEEAQKELEALEERLAELEARREECDKTYMHLQDDLKDASNHYEELKKE